MSIYDEKAQLIIEFKKTIRHLPKKERKERLNEFILKQRGQESNTSEQTNLQNK